MKINDNIYDVLCWIGRIFLPALAVFVTTLGTDLGLANADVISKVIMALDVFLNALLQQSSVTYYKEQATTEEETTVNGHEKDENSEEGQG